MADTTSTSLQLVDQQTGGNNNSWGDIADSNFTKGETAIAGVAPIASLTGGTRTLSDDENRHAILVCTGALSADQILTVRTAPKWWHVVNQTSGAFDLSLKTASGSAALIPQSKSKMVFCDGTDVIAFDIVDVFAATASEAGYILLGEDLDNGSSNVKIQAAAEMAADWTFTLPDGPGTDLFYLQTDGAGLTTWAALTAASETVAGIAELATVAETEAATDTARTVTPAGLANFAQLAKSQTFSKAKRHAIVSLTDSGTVLVDFDDGNNFNIVLEGDRIIGNPSNLVAGQTGQFIVTMDGVGGRKPTWASKWKASGNNNLPPQPSQAPNAKTVYRYFVFDTDNVLIWLAWIESSNSIGSFIEYDEGTVGEGSATERIHNLNRYPALVEISFEITQAFSGFSVGQRISFATFANLDHPNTNDQKSGITVAYDTTKVSVYVGADGFRIINSSFLHLTFDVSRAKLIIRVYE